MIDPKHPLFPWLLLANITLATILAIISSVATNVANDTIQGALIMNASQTQWITNGYLMMLGVSLPIAPWLAEKFGYKKLYFIGLAVFIFGSGLSGLAVNFHSLLIFRIIEGAGGGILFPVSLTIIARTFPAKQLALAVSTYTGIGFGLGVTAGFFIGGFCAQYLNWQLIFFFNLVIGIPSLFITWILHQETEKKKSPPFDYFGYGFFILFLVNLLIAVNSAKQPWNTEGWTSHLILTCLTLSFIGIITTVIIEAKHHNPIIVLSLFKTKSFTLGVVAIAFVGGILFGTATFIPIYLEDNLGYDKFKTGLMLVPVGIILGIIGSVLGILGKKLNMKYTSMIGLTLLALSCFLNDKITIQSDQMQFLAMLFLRSVGVAFSLGPLTTLALSQIPRELSGPASSLITFFRQMGAAFGSSTIGVIVVDRTVFHKLMYGSQVQLESPAFQGAVATLKSRLEFNLGYASDQSQVVSEALIRKYVSTQAEMSAINDAFYALGWILVLIIALIVLESLWSYFRAKKKLNLASSSPR